ncbi:protein FAR1-RELATED SEQUENCE 5-like [Chenopodium quinoa]|uniref:protein FAR1-RELATED SEQUENCE 5-like n=1 Tax=Chenopodium quinoa TaxID=63459 RepID=UPI000B77EEA2|nr:protein FAR1-RELATED SEQUENCE 5-like [Chenopodium quinoa]
MKIAGEQQSVEIPILGKTDERKRKEREVNETRTGCKAHIRFKKNTEGRFFVLAHKLEHNHELVITVQRHHLRSERQISAPMDELIESMIESGIKPMDAYNYISNEAGGEECVGHTKRDHLNYVSRVKMSMVEGGDMQNVLNTLQERVDQDPSFFYRLKFGEENNVVSYFWRDSQMLEDFKAYGDVLIFDTTYRTNKYGLICAPFVGINNHWKTTMFGCAFITDEKTDTFVWLLSIFKKSMCGIEPKSIFTDQDLAMSNAIPEANRTTKLLEFFHIFEATVRRWRSTEKSDNFRCTTEKPKTTTKILKHAAKVYTLNLYKDFKLEFDTSLGAYAKEKPTSMQYVKFFDVSLDEDYMHTYQVIYHCQNNEFMCSCMCFTETGLMCFHILKIMQM